jgi:hypothetical protein
MKTQEVGTETFTNAFLQPDGKKGTDNPGDWKEYAGPVIEVAPGCIRWGGTAGGTTFDSAKEQGRDHCSS